MPTPDRPDFDEVIDTAWGDFIHDAVAGTVRGRFTCVQDAGGYATITNATLGLVSVSNAVATIFSQPEFPDAQVVWVAVLQAVPAGIVMRFAVQASPGVTGSAWRFMDATDPHPVVNLIAWGTPTP